MNTAQVHSLVIASAGQLCRQRGWDVDELVQDVVLELLRLARTRSRFDPGRGAWSTYVTRVCRSVVGDRLARLRCEARAAQVLEREAGGTSIMGASPDEGGLDDEQAARLDAVRADTARVLTHVGYQAVFAWMLHGREVAGLAAMSGVDELTLWRYLALQLGRLRRGAAPEWVQLWERHRAYAVRRLRGVRQERGHGRAEAARDGDGARRRVGVGSAGRGDRG